MRAREFAGLVLLCAVFADVGALAGGPEGKKRAGVAPNKLQRAYYYAPEAKTSRSSYVYFHGICGRAENGCAVFAGASTSSWLLCPRAPVACGGGDSWSDAQTAHTVVFKAQEELKKSEPSFEPEKHVAGAIAFSQGGYVLQDLVRKNIGGFDRALVIGADVRFTAAELRKAGIKRAAVGAGQYDGTYVALKKTAKALEAEGFSIRFVDLGKVGHTYIAEAGNEEVENAIRWLDEATSS